HLPLGLAGLLQAHPVLAGQRLDRRRGHPGRRRRVQLERAVDDLDLIAVGETLQRLLKVPLAEIAPWAHDVRPDLDLHGRVNAPDRAAVHAFFEAATARGAEVLHEPRVWPEYHASYYGAFVRDPDGNNVEAVCHQPG